MNEVRHFIADALESTLDAISYGAGAHYGVAEQGTEWPYYTFQKIDGNPNFTFGATETGATESHVTQFYQVKALAVNTTTESGQDIAEDLIVAACEALLGLTINGTGDLQISDVRVERDLPDYPEMRPQGRTVYHVGKTFRIILRKI